MRGSLTAVRLLTLLLFLLLIAVCAYWALQILAPRPAIAPSASIGDAAAAPNLEPATTLFGAAGSAVAVTDSGNIQVSGIAEAGPEGVVILSIDGKPGAAYGVNTNVTEAIVVKSVELDKVVLDQRGKLIELKTPTRASLDVLSSGVGKPRAPSDSGTAPPVPSRTVAPPPQQQQQQPQSQPRFQPPQPPQQQQMQQQQQQQQQQMQDQMQLQQQQQQLQQQQMERPAQQAGQPPNGQPLPPGGGSGGTSQPGAGASANGGSSTAVSGQRQLPGQPQPGGQANPQ